MLLIYGHYSLICAFVLLVVFIILLFLFFTVHEPVPAQARAVYYKIAKKTYIITVIKLYYLALNISFLSLLYSYASSDVTLLIVLYYSNTNESLFYKICNLWTNNEGSLFLWNWTIATYIYIYILFCEHILSYFFLKTVSIKILLNAFFLYIIITVSNPFVKTTFLSLNSLGFELNAILHNPLLLVHPPLMYFGYAGTLIGFTYIISLILQHNLYLQKLLKMWIILNWTCLTFGIILGSWWAYQELGWGGIWFWDPVENLSLMAWLINTTLLHLLSNKYNKKTIVKTWLIILLNVAFLISYISIFLIRSGLLLTVHNFVTNIKINLYLLSCLVILMSFILFVYFAKAVQGIIQTYFVIYNIENFIFLNNLLFVMMFMILSLNLVSELGAKSSQSIIFENSFFKDILSSISVVILLLFIGNILLVLNKLIKLNKINFLFFLGVNCLFFSYNLLNLNQSQSHIQSQSYSHSQFNKISFLMLLFIYFAGILVFIYVLVKKNNKILPHLSILSFFSFLTISNFFEYDNVDMLSVGEKFNILEYNYILRDISILKNKIYYIIYSNILFFQTDQNFAVFFPEKHYYFLQNLTISKPSIFSNYAGDFYTIFNNGNFWLGYSIKVIFKPVLTLLWSSIIVVLVTVLAVA